MCICVCMCVLTLCSNNTDLNSKLKNKALSGESFVRGVLLVTFLVITYHWILSLPPHLEELSPFIFSS